MTMFLHIADIQKSKYLANLAIIVDVTIASEELVVLAVAVGTEDYQKFFLFFLHL